MAVPICEFYKYGHCKFLERCRKKHIKEVCENINCEIIDCQRRHPKPCRFFQMYGHCKFEYCSYGHTDSKEMMKLKELKLALEVKSQDIQILRNSLADQTEQIKSLESKLIETSRQVANLQAQHLEFLTPQPETNSVVEKRIKEVEDNNYVLLHAVDDLERSVKVLQSKLSRLTSSYECDVCKKVFPTEVILKNHLWSDHGSHNLFDT